MPRKWPGSKHANLNDDSSNLFQPYLYPTQPNRTRRQFICVQISKHTPCAERNLGNQKRPTCSNFLVPEGCLSTTSASRLPATLLRRHPPFYIPTVYLVAKTQKHTCIQASATICMYPLSFCSPALPYLWPHDAPSRALSLAVSPSPNLLARTYASHAATVLLITKCWGEKPKRPKKKDMFVPSYSSSWPRMTQKCAIVAFRCHT